MHRLMRPRVTRALHTAAIAATDAAPAAAAVSASTPAVPATLVAAVPAAAAVVKPTRAPSRTAGRPALLQRTPRPPFLFLAAPLEDVSDTAWRRLVHAQGAGADFTFSEMARVENLARKATGRSGTSWFKTEHGLEASLLRAASDDSDNPPPLGLEGPLTPTVVQLLVNREESLHGFLRAFTPTPGSFAGFNLNYGCPSPDVMGLGLGAQAVKRMAKAQGFVGILNEWIAKNCTGKEWDLPSLPAGSSVPAGPAENAPLRPGVSIKMRLGASQHEMIQAVHINLIRALRGDTPNGSRAASELSATATTAASSGPVSYFILHGRHGKEHYESRADLGAVARTILHTGAPNIIANGDIHLARQVSRCVAMGAAGVMIGRAAVKDPLIFQRLKADLRTELPDTPLLGVDVKMPSLLGLLPEHAHPEVVVRTDDFDFDTSLSAVLSSPTMVQSPSPQMLSQQYSQFARAFATPLKYQHNVRSRIGKPFEPNPRPGTSANARNNSRKETTESSSNNNSSNGTTFMKTNGDREAGQYEQRKPYASSFASSHSSFRDKPRGAGGFGNDERRRSHTNDRNSKSSSSSSSSNRGHFAARDDNAATGRPRSTPRNDYRSRSSDRPRGGHSSTSSSSSSSFGSGHRRGDENGWRSDSISAAAAAPVVDERSIPRWQRPLGSMAPHRDTRPGHFVPDWSGSGGGEEFAAKPNGAPRGTGRGGRSSSSSFQPRRHAGAGSGGRGGASFGRRERS